MAAAILMALRLDLKDYLMDKKLKNLNFMGFNIYIISSCEEGGAVL